jgi:cytochrome P450
MEARIEAIAHELIDGFVNDGQCDFYHRFAYPFPLSVVCDMLGIPRAEEERLNWWALCNVNLRWGNLDHQAYRAAAQGRVDFYRFGEQLIAERRRNPGSDILSELVCASDASADPLAERELVGQFMTFITAGHETSANWLTIGLYHLLSDGTAWERHCHDPNAITGVVEETLRFCAPSQALWRTTSRDVEVAGFRIPAGARVCIAIGSANRDATVFACPEQLDVQRPDVGKHVGFGWGIHFCLGAQLARLEGAVAFRLLAERLPGLRLQPGVALRFKPNATLRVPESLPVVWDVRG